jgi:RHS repeat-associated protein
MCCEIINSLEPDGSVISYNDKGLSAKATNGLGNAASTDYDEHDRIRAITDARGNVTRFVRDAAGRVIKTEYADGTSAAVEYNAFGQITKSTDATGKASSFVYDEYGRPTSSFDAAGNERKTEYAQIGGGDAPLGRPSKQISPEGRTVVLNYDARGRVVSQTSAAGTTLASTTKFAYDAVGRKTSVTNGRNKTTQFFYNDRGLRIKAMNALNNAVSYNYDAAGRKLSQTDAKGNTTRWTYDGMGRVLTITDAKAQMTRFTYNTAGQRATLTDAKGSVYRFEYDLLGRQTAMVYPDGSKETATYNEVGNKATITNRAGAVCTYTYDSRNREIASEWSDGSQRITKAYDAAGRMVLEDNGISRITYAYDSLGRLASETEDLTKLPGAEDKDPVARTLRYTYTADGKRDSLTYPDGSFLKYAYDAKGQLTDVLGDGVPPPIASYVYDMAGNATRLPRENATETAMAYDDVNRLTEMTDSRSSGRKSPISVLDYAYDEADNRTSTTQSFDSDGDGSVEVTKDSYGYDATYQVTDVSYGKNEQVSYTYDAVGNRMSVNEDGKVSLYNVNSLNQYTQVDRFMPSYDRNGNLASMGEWIYKYDAMNRLCRATNGRMEARFYYDAKNRCVARSYNGEITFNYYDGWKLIEERDSKGRQLARYVHGKRIDEIVVMVNQRGVFYPHRDVLGNVTFLTDTAGRVVERYSYSVDGKVTVSDNRGGILKGSAVGNRFMYTGREWLPKVGLYDYRNRVYSAELGRFVQTDPIRFSAGDVNIYRYVANAMLNRSDAFGLLDLVAGIDLDFAFVGGIDLNYGLVIDTNSAGNSGFFFSPGPSVGDTFGLSIFLGAVDSVGGITRNYDVNMGLFSITSSYNTDGSFNGTVLGYGPGYGSALSLTFTSEITLQSVFLDPANAANNLQDNIVPAIQGDDPSAVNSGAEPISAIEKFVQGMERYFDLISSILNGE